MYHQNAQGLNKWSKSISNAKSLENIWDRLKNSNSVGRLTDGNIITNYFTTKKQSHKSSSNASDWEATHSSSSPNLFEVISPRDEKWVMVQEALTNSLLGKNIIRITEVLCCVRQLAEQSVTKMMVEFYEMQILRNTLHKMQKKMTTISDIEECWVQFYRKSLPNVTLIFSSLKTQQELIENISLFEFKRRVTKVEDLKEKIEREKNNREYKWNNFTNMLLILQPVRGKEGHYTDIDAIFEEATALVISPLIGYRGVYVDGHLILHSLEAPIYTNISNSESKRKLNKGRKSLSGIFFDSKSLLDISGNF